MEACFAAFDKDEDGSININEFSALCKALFRNEKGKPYKLDSQQVSDLFMIFNTSGDGSMSKQEFVYCWNGWIKKIVRPQSALVVVDVQNDFISGSLALHRPVIEAAEEQDNLETRDAALYIQPRMLDTVPFDMHCYSLDWHPKDHISFIENVGIRTLAADSPIQDGGKCNLYDLVIFEGPPKTSQILWPAHCIQESWGAELHKDLKVHPNAKTVFKGVNPQLDSYSAFYDNQKLSKTILDELIRKEGVSDLYICGIATDVCVASTAFHALELGFRTALVSDASRGINLENINAAYNRIKEEHGVIVNSTEVKAMVQGRDRRPELGYKLALECRKNITYPAKNKNSKYNKQITNNDGNMNGNETISNPPQLVRA
ncbi:uncharacterized protein LOC111712678 [Eurytemora carolleeae]|uniref:uncharacterized protein LOC111712678 n=1 Tax=Eurytemora carolleeae TaxID=1294199 RepID=UPI000C76E84C|nr:uncharacterized protein LOC111712678 [Eurytemora carolleeae]|eukprot:XP_023343129.1 uncharacterized protein LOC111712678 [Eurytemora affinis]